MPGSLDARAIRAMAERLIAVRSVSPDVAGESACGRALEAGLPAGLQQGAWLLPDGRPIIWARVPGEARSHSQRALLLLGHYDTVGIAEYASLGDTAGEVVALAPARLRELLIERENAGRLPEDVMRDVEEELRKPGTWMFGRGALDMKSGLCAGVAVLGALAAEPAEGDVLFVATPDEEHESAGVLAAVSELAKLGERENISWTGAINLDYGDGPGAYAGAMGKMLAGLWILGVPAHASDPGRGVDAARLAADVAVRLTRSPALRDVLETPPALLRLRDRKPAYDAQTAAEADVYANLMTGGTDALVVLRVLEDEVKRIATDLSSEPGAWPQPVRVITWNALRQHADPAAADQSGVRDIREHTSDVVRNAAMRAGLDGPAIVSYLQMPFYPAWSDAGLLGTAVEGVMAAEGLELRGAYPHITDASYLRWDDAASGVASSIPSFGTAYRLPVEAMQALDLDVVNVGPSGRGAHGLYERVHARYAFETLPRLIESVVRVALSDRA